MSARMIVRSRVFAVLMRRLGAAKAAKEAAWAAWQADEGNADLLHRFVRNQSRCTRLLDAAALWNGGGL